MRRALMHDRSCAQGQRASNCEGFRQRVFAQYEGDVKKRSGEQRWLLPAPIEIPALTGPPCQTFTSVRPLTRGSTTTFFRYFPPAVLASGVERSSTSYQALNTSEDVLSDVPRGFRGLC